MGEKIGSRVFALTALLLLLALGLWEATAAAGYVDPFFFSRPSLLWQEFWTMLHSGMLARHLSVTAQEAGLGLLLGGTLFGGNIL